MHSKLTQSTLTGGHGYGLRPSKELVTSWPKRVEEWMQNRGWLAKK